MENIIQIGKKLEGWLVTLYEKKGGWPAVQIDDDIGTLTTGEALRVLFSHTDFSLAKAEVALTYLFESQNRSGAWPLIHGRHLDSIISTSEIILAFSVAYKKFSSYDIANKISKRLSNAIDWLLDEQNEDGGWGYASYDRVGMENVPNYKKSNLYATCIAILSLISATEVEILKKEEISTVINATKKYLSSCRDTNTQLWKLYPSYSQTSLSLSALAAYVLFKINGADLGSTKNFLINLGFDINREIISLPIESIPMQLPDGEVAFYINGAYWAMKFFVENNIPYAGVVSFLKYINKNKEFNYFRAQCFATEIAYPQVVWFSIEVFDILKKLEKSDESFVNKCIINASLFLSNINSTNIFDEYIDKLFEINTFLEMVDKADDRQDLIIIDNTIKLLCTLEFFEKNSISGLIQERLIHKLSTINDYHAYYSTSEIISKLEYTSFFDINIKIFRILENISTGNIETAKQIFLVDICSQKDSHIKYKILDAIFDLIASLIFSESKEIFEEKLYNIQVLVSDRFNKCVLSDVLSNISVMWNKLHMTVTQTESEISPMIEIQDDIRIDQPISVPEELIGREDLLANTIEAIISNKNKILMISGEFRMGKTSFIKCLTQGLINKDSSFSICQIDFSNELGVSPSMQQFASLILKKIKEVFTESGIKNYQTDKVKAALTSFVKKFSGITVAGWGINFQSTTPENTITPDDEALNALNNFFTAIDEVLKRESKKVLVIIDEYARLGIIDSQLGKVFDALIRGLSQHTENIYFILVGQNITDLNSSDKSATFTTIAKLIPLVGWENENNVRILLNKINPSIIIDLAQAKEIIKICGGNPYWIKYLVKYIIKLLNQKRTYNISSEIIEESINIFMKDLDVQAKLNWNFNATTDRVEYGQEILIALAQKIDYFYDRDALHNELDVDVSKSLNALRMKGTIEIVNRKYSIKNKLLKIWIKDFMA